MHFNELPNELLLEVFYACSSIQDALHLATVNRHLHRVFSGSKKLPILFGVAETQYGPLQDAIQVVTYNASQPVHHLRHAPESFALLKQLVDMGKTMSKWIEIFPAKKWREDFEDRRLLRDDEIYRIRRALYRLTLYCRAFHNARHPRLSRMHRQTILERAELLHNWSTAELAEIEDVRCVIREIVQSHICPSNGTIQHKFRKRFPDSNHQLLFNLNIHLNYPPPAAPATAFFQEHFHSTHQLTPSSRVSAAMAKYVASPVHEPGGEGWGDDIPHYYIVEDMMKLDPGQIMWLRENAPMKGMVQMYVRNLGEWFDNNGETFGQTLEWVLAQRGDDVEEFREGIECKILGVVTER